jgi:aspartyl aminopeptidase
VDIDRDLMLIPNVAIHMNRSANDGYKWDMTRDVLPLLGGKEAAGKLQQLLEEAAGGKLLSGDLFLYIREKARVWGVEGEYLSAQALDDLGCVWTCLQGFLHGSAEETIPVLCVFDNEEVGSSSSQGADSNLLELLLSRICQGLGLSEGEMLAQSMMVSADNAHALHPNHPELADPKNAPVMGQGIVLKLNSTLRYTTDGYSAALFRAICRKAGVKVQSFYNRADILGGSTLGNISVGHVSVPSVDIGLPQLAMHSSFETCAVADVVAMEEALTAFYSTVVERPEETVSVLN